MQNHEMIGNIQIQIPVTNNSTPRYISQNKDPLIQQDTYTAMFIEASFTITKMWALTSLLTQQHQPPWTRQPCVHITMHRIGCSEKRINGIIQN